MLPKASAVFQNPSLSDNAPYGVFTVGNDGRILSFNAKAADLWGRAPTLGQDFYYGNVRCFSMNGRELAVHETPMAQAILRGIASPEQEAIVERPDGSRTTWCLSVEPVREGDAIIGAVAFFRAKPCGSSFENLGDEALPTLIGYVGNDLRYRFANAAYESWFGIPEREIVGKTLEEVLGSAAYAEIAPEMRLALDGASQEFERFIPTAAGNSRFLLLRLVPDTAPGGFVRGTAIIGSDVSATRRAELEELAQGKKFEAALAAAHLGTWALDHRSGTLSWSESAAAMLGLPAPRPMSTGEFLAFVPPANRSALRDELHAGLASAHRFHLRFPVQPPGEESAPLRWLEAEGFGSATPESPYVVGVIREIQSDNQHRTSGSADFLRHLTNTIPHIVWTFDGANLTLNDRWWKYIGVEPSADAADTLRYVHPEDRALVEATWARCQKEDLAFEARYRLLRHDGVYRWHLGRMVPGYKNQGVTTTWFGTATDIEDGGHGAA